MSNLDYVPVSRKSDLILFACGIGSFFVFLIFLDATKALACSVMLGAFLSVIQTKPKSRRDWRFWTIIAILAIAHILVLSLVHIPEFRFGLMSLPFALVDGFAMWGLINWIERRFPIARDDGANRGAR